MSEPASPDQSTHQAVRGVRWLFWLNAATLPMSFVTNLVLGRAGTEVLGLYAAIQLFIGGFQTFFLFGGNAVFTRIVPALPASRRTPFLATYIGLVLAVFGVVAAVSLAAVPDLVRSALGRFGDPSLGMALGVAACVVVWAFCSHFLYGVERAPQAAVALKLVVVGYFALSLLCLSSWGPRLLAAPARTLWVTTAGTYGAAALIAALFVARLDEAAATRRLGWCLPAGFWPVVVYTHLGKVVEFVYTGLSSSMVLVWLDIAALGRLSAALRWVALIALLPGMLVSVVAPGLTRLDVSGLRSEALRQARAAIRIADLAVVPSVLGLVLFAPSLMGLFGQDYRDHAGLLHVVALSALAGPLVYLGGGLAVAFGALRAYLTVSVVYVVASLALNVLLVPRFGLPGAAVATTVSSAVQGLVVAWVVHRLGLVLPRSTPWGGAFGVATLLFVRWVEPGWVVAGAAWAAATGAYAWTVGLTRAEFRLLTARLLGSAK